MPAPRLSLLSACAGARTRLASRSLCVSAPLASSVRRSELLFTPTPEHGALREMVRRFAAEEVEPQALVFNREERFNEALFGRLGELGLLGLTASDAHGGAGADAVSSVIVHEELSASDPAFCLSYLAHSLLFVNNLSVNGSEAQKAAWLPRACSGELLCGMAMSEPGAGTDVLGMATTATREGSDFILRGTKLWITNGARREGELGDVFLVYARTEGSHSLFIVPKGTPGFSLGQRIKDKCGMRASNTAELVFDGARVPAESALVGKQGDAVGHMMRNLEIERLALAAMSLGIARRCIDVMNSYAQERKAFGQPINRYGQIQHYIATSYAEYAAARAYVYNTASSIDLSASGSRLDSDGVKLYASKMATEVANRAVQT